jgi:Rrf2 family protein
MFRVSRQTDYAIRVVLALAEQPEGTRLPSARIGKDMLIPPAFLSRIVARLAQAKLVLSFPGRHGGLQLPRSAAIITLREVIEAMEGPFLLSECMQGEEACPFEGGCPVRSRWSRLQTVILDELGKTNFKLLAAEANPVQTLKMIGIMSN